MAAEFLNYDVMVQGALKGVVREALTQVAVRGLLGPHHFFISFRTDYPGVVVPPYLQAQYPHEMTIVLQYQFYDLEVSNDAFSVTLTFNTVPERLTVPFAALTRFADPPVNFGLQLTSGEPAGQLAAPGESRSGKSESSAQQEKPAEGEAQTGKVITLDSFRKS